MRLRQLWQDATGSVLCGSCEWLQKWNLCVIKIITLFRSVFGSLSQRLDWDRLRVWAVEMEVDLLLFSIIYSWGLPLLVHSSLPKIRKFISFFLAIRNNDFFLENFSVKFCKQFLVLFHRKLQLDRNIKLL
jgi:hypothetical protein